MSRRSSAARCDGLSARFFLDSSSFAGRAYERPEPVRCVWNVHMRESGWRVAQVLAEDAAHAISVARANDTMLACAPIETFTAERGAP